MPPNDVVSLKLFYADWCSSRLNNGKAPGGIQQFEYFCTEQFLKPFSLNDEELLRGMIGDHDDGGIDAFYCFVDRILIDDNTRIDRRAEYQVDLIIMQIRENKGFSPTAIDKMNRFTDDLLDLQRGPDDYRYGYHQRLQDLMRIFKQKVLAMSNFKMRLNYYFVTGRDEPPNPNCNRATKALPTTIGKYFSSETRMNPFNFAGAESLYKQTKIRPPSEKSLEFERSFEIPEGWIGLVSLKKFYVFLKDEKSPHQLNETIFDDNVRGYFLNTQINRAITTTLTHPKEQPEFWLLNNGITIITPSATSKGGVLEIRDPQIVNGLQTSRRIFDYYKQESGLPEPDNRRILIRVIQNDNPEFRDEIIRATNNQNKMPAEALISTGRLHKQIDRYFQENDLYYDRRKGHYKDQGISVYKIVSVLTVVQAVVAIVLRRPDDARGRPGDYIKDDRKRWNVFGPDEYKPPAQPTLIAQTAPYDVAVYLQCVLILKRVDEFLETQSLTNEKKRNIRFYLMRYASCALTKNAHCPPGELSRIKIQDLTDNELQKYFDVIHDIYVKHGGNDEAAKGKYMASDIDGILLREYSMPNVISGGRKRTRKAKT